MRKLAYIEKIEWIKDIPNADKIQVCGILGWECVIKKGEFNVGEKIIYVETDSIMPEEPEYEFLRERKFRIKIIKLKGQVSMGLVLPLSLLHKNDNLLKKVWENKPLGYDVTDDLKITKYLSPSEREEIEQAERKALTEKNRLKKFMMRYSWFRRFFLSRKQKNGFPYWIKVTDEERVQKIPNVLEDFKDSIVYVTEKVDFQSVTFTSKPIPRFNNWFGIKMFNLLNKKNNGK